MPSGAHQTSGIASPTKHGGWKELLQYNFRCQQWFKRSCSRPFIPEWKCFKCVLRWPKNQERKQWITDEEEMNLKENPNKAAFIILSSWFICLVWMSISLSFSVTVAALERHSSLSMVNETRVLAMKQGNTSSFQLPLLYFGQFVNNTWCLNQYFSTIRRSKSGISTGSVNLSSSDDHYSEEALWRKKRGPSLSLANCFLVHIYLWFPLIFSSRFLCSPFVTPPVTQNTLT